MKRPREAATIGWSREECRLSKRCPAYPRHDERRRCDAHGSPHDRKVRMLLLQAWRDGRLQEFSPVRWKERVGESTGLMR